MIFLVSNSSELNAVTDLETSCKLSLLFSAVTIISSIEKELLTIDWLFVSTDSSALTVFEIKIDNKRIRVEFLRILNVICPRIKKSKFIRD